MTAAAGTCHSSYCEAADRCTVSSDHSRTMGHTRCRATPSRQGDRLFATLSGRSRKIFTHVEAVFLPRERFWISAIPWMLGYLGDSDFISFGSPIAKLRRQDRTFFRASKIWCLFYTSVGNKLKVSHQKLQQWLSGGHAVAANQLGQAAPWPKTASTQSEWTALSHFTLGCAMSEIIQPNQLGTLSLRVSTTTLAPLLWCSAQLSNVVFDWSPQQMGLDFCLMGPTANRVHYMTAESETGKSNSVDISLSKKGYIWDWSKLLGDVSEHRLLIAVVQGSARRAALISNLVAFYAGKSKQGIQHEDGIGGYVFASELRHRADSFTFVVNHGVLEFQNIPPGTF